MAARDWGVLSRDELRACELTERMIATRVRTERLDRVHRGVYAVGHAGLTMRARFLAAVKACGEGAALSHVSAAVLWGLLTYDEARQPDVIARQDKRIDGVNTHRTRNPAPTIRYDRITVTTPQRTLVDLSSVLPFKPLRRAVREALVRKRITADEATRIVKGGDQPTRSPLEDAVLDLIEAKGLPAPQVNQPFGKYVPDFRWPGLHLILEADGATYHDNPITREDDAHRQAQLEAQGETVIRIRGSPGTGPAPTA
jgi:Protein of unknown function (DUF559)/Transcriptional regulator, AbiEi antitoxin